MFGSTTIASAIGWRRYRILIQQNVNMCNIVCGTCFSINIDILLVGQLSTKDVYNAFRLCSLQCVQQYEYEYDYDIQLPGKHIRQSVSIQS